VLGEVHGGAHVEVDQAQHGLDPYDRTRSCTPTGRYERETARVSDDGARRGSAAASDAELPIPGRRIARHTVERVTAKSSSSARANQVRLKLGDHGQYAEQQPTDRPTGSVGSCTEVPSESFTWRLVSSWAIARVLGRPPEPIEPGHRQRVAGAARRPRRAQPARVRRRTVAARQLRIVGDAFVRDDASAPCGARFPAQERSERRAVGVADERRYLVVAQAGCAAQMRCTLGPQAVDELVWAAADR